MRRDEVLTILREILPNLREQYAVETLAIFGSVARDEAGPESDVDVLVDFSGPTTFLGYMGVKETLEQCLGCSVDVVTPRALKARLRAAIEGDLLHVA